MTDADKALDALLLLAQSVRRIAEALERIAQTKEKEQ